MRALAFRRHFRVAGNIDADVPLATYFFARPSADNVNAPGAVAVRRDGSAAVDVDVEVASARVPEVLFDFDSLSAVARHRRHAVDFDHDVAFAAIHLVSDANAVCLLFFRRHGCVLAVDVDVDVDVALCFIGRDITVNAVGALAVRREGRATVDVDVDVALALA